MSTHAAAADVAAHERLLAPSVPARPAVDQGLEPAAIPLRIAIEAWAAVEVQAGRGRYVRELLRALAKLPGDHEFVLLCRTPGENLGPRMRWRVVPGSGARWLARAARVASREADVLFAPTSYALTGLVRVPAVGLVHDLVAFNRSLRSQPGSYLEWATLPVAARRARTLLCVSQTTRDALLERHPEVASRSSVTPLAASARFSRTPPDASAARAPRDRPSVRPRRRDARAAQEPRRG